MVRAMSTGFQASRSTGDVEVAHFWAEGDGRQMLDAVLEEFRSRHPDVSVTDRSYDNHGLAIKSRILQEDPPSLFVEWPGGNMEPYHEADALRSIDDVWRENGWAEAFIEGPRERAQMGGEYVAVPLDIHRMNNVFYRVEAAEAVGVDPSRIADPREFLEVLRQCEDGDRIGMHQPMKDPSDVLQLWANIFIGQFGAEAFAAVTGGDVGGHESEIEEAVELVDRYADLASDDAAFLGMIDASDRFVDGGSVFFHHGDWMGGIYAEVDGFDYGRDWERADFPGTDGVYMMGIDSIVAADDGEALSDGARTFLEFVGSAPALETLNRAKGSIPPRRDVSMDAFPRFLQEQFRDFEAASHFPAGHALQVDPETYIETQTAFSEFVADRDVERTARALVEAYRD